jgi:2-oxo-4-hydroxy-4-carboxy--5-ureidoimidazoline (OHCU) decarboxylase
VTEGPPGERTRPPGVAELDLLDPAGCEAALAPLFEGAPRFLARLCAARPFADEAGLFAAARRIAHAMPEAEQVELIDAHPRLGADPASVSPLSYREQGYDRAPTGAAAPETPSAETRAEDLAARLADLNGRYEARFGFRYCVFVAGRSRAELLPGFEAALRADRAAELARAIDDAVAIARDRYRRLRTGQHPGHADA